MRLHENVCLICERPLLDSQKTSRVHDRYYYTCPHCGRFGVTGLGSLSLEWKSNNLRWDAKEQALIAGWIRSRALRGTDDVPLFGYSQNKGGTGAERFVYPEDVLNDVPRAIDDQLRETLINLGHLCDGNLGKWVILNRETDLPLCFAANIDEAALVFQGLQDDGHIKYELTMSTIRVQLTIGGWRYFERLRAGDESNKQQPAPAAAVAPSGPVRNLVSASRNG